MLILALSFSLFGCGTSGIDKVDNQKKERSELVKKEDSKKKLGDSKKDSEASSGNALQESVTGSTTEDSKTATPVEKKATATATTPTLQTGTTNSNQTSTAKTNPTSTTTINASSTPASPVEPSQPSKPEPAKPTVTISISGPKEQGTIIGETNETIEVGATVLDVLLQVTKTKGIPVYCEGSGASAYVKSINNIKASGANGWIYKLNGTLVMKGAGAVKVKDGDKISWSYTDN